MKKLRLAEWKSALRKPMNEAVLGQLKNSCARGCCSLKSSVLRWGPHTGGHRCARQTHCFLWELLLSPQGTGIDRPAIAGKQQMAFAMGTPTVPEEGRCRVGRRAIARKRAFLLIFNPAGDRFKKKKLNRSFQRSKKWRPSFLWVSEDSATTWETPQPLLPIKSTEKLSWDSKSTAIYLTQEFCRKTAERGF